MIRALERRPLATEPDELWTQFDEIAEQFFRIYNDAGQARWRTFDGRVVPAWSSLGDDVQAKWRAVALAAFDALAEDERKDPCSSTP
jgi:hypothetical protein